MWETQVWSLCWENPLKQATHSSILAGKSHGCRSLVGYSPWGLKEWGTTEWLTHTHTHTHQLSFLRQRAGLSLPSFFVVAVCSYLILLLLLIYMYFTSCMPIPKLNGILLIMKDMLVKMEHEKGKSYYIYLQP